MEGKTNRTMESTGVHEGDRKNEKLRRQNQQKHLRITNSIMESTGVHKGDHKNEKLGRQNQ